MTEHISIERMNEALDGLLVTADMEALERHILGCAACRNDYARLSETVMALRALPRSATAPDEAWAGIASRIHSSTSDEMASYDVAAEEATVLRLPTATMPSMTRRLSFTIPQLAAAAIVVSVLSAGTVWMALEDVATTAAPTADLALESLGGAAARAVWTEGSRYVEVVDQLQRILQEGRGVLASETLGTIEESLGTLDNAIADIETALAADPNSDLLLRMLANHQRTKLGVLQRAAAAVQAQT